jgi:hypothetical protein
MLLAGKGESMKRKLRVGVVGCGNIAYWVHLPALARMRGVELVAAADPDPRARDDAARLVKRPVFQRSEDLFARNDIDAVVICAPPVCITILPLPPVPPASISTSRSRLRRTRTQDAEFSMRTRAMG